MNNRWTVAKSGVDYKRSVFPMKSDHKTTFDAGVFVPIFLQEILPGDTVKMKMNYVVRQSTMLKPVMDNSYIDTYFFFCPWRVIWKHLPEFFGENNSGAWVPTTNYTIPKISFTSVGAKSVADYLGVPPGTYSSLTINALPFRAYAKIWNDFFRDENVNTPAANSDGDTTITGTGSVQHPDQNATAYVTGAYAGGSLCPVNKYHDMFTSCLPTAQKALLPVSVPIAGNAPIVAETNLHSMTQGLKFACATNAGYSGDYSLVTENPSGANAGSVYTSNSTTSKSLIGQINRTNLVADLSSVTMATINDLRFAFQLQKFYEKNARGGTRYIEFLKSQYGVTSSDARLQRSEFLAGHHDPLNVGTVFQTSASGGTSTPQANEAAYSVTGSSSEYFVKSFEEHGYLMGFACVRTDHTYQNGLEKLWTRTNVTDIFLPVFSQIGEQPVYSYQITLPSSGPSSSVFGFNEAWCEYRYMPNRISSEFRASYTTPLTMWHYADNFITAPSLNTAFMHETKVNIDRTLAVTGQSQYIGDFYFDETIARVMPLYSVPGLIDHY